MTMPVLPTWAHDPATRDVLAALADGRSLPASAVVAETGRSGAAVALGLARLAEIGIATSVQCGRWRYHRLTGPEALEGLQSVLAAQGPIASRRPGTPAHAIRAARRCYGHPAGRFGVAITDALRSRGYLEGHDGGIDLDRLSRPRMSGGVLDDALYQLTDAGAVFLAELGFPVPKDRRARCCIDWTEQRHHLAGELGRCLLTGLRAQGWVSDSATPRALVISDPGWAAVHHHLGLVPFD